MSHNNRSAYEAAGVQIEKGYESVERMKKHIQRTTRPEVMSQVGGFGGLFSLANRGENAPVLVSGTDGVGTKIILAQQAKKYDTIGIDCVAMCVNDVLAQGAEPLFFLDYLAVGKVIPQMVEDLVAGVAQGCVEAGAALIGGETAEMPDVYGEDSFDLAGFCVGMADQENLLNLANVTEGNVLIGLPSSGIHSNGYSLVRKVFFKDNKWEFETKLDNGKSLIDELLTPTRIYVKDVLPLLKKNMINGIAHITGGGFEENLPRMFDATDLQAVVSTDTWQVPEIFNLIQEQGQISSQEMYNIFNMGIGLVLAIPVEHEAAVLAEITDAKVIGRIQAKTSEVAVELKIKEQI